jgi:hypothetical protein
VKKVTRKDCVKDMGNGWHGATGHGDAVKRMFRTKEEAEIADALFKGANEPVKPKAGK